MSISIIILLNKKFSKHNRVNILSCEMNILIYICLFILSFLFLVIVYDLFFIINTRSCRFILLLICIIFLIFYKNMLKKHVYIIYLVEKKTMSATNRGSHS